MKNCLTWVSEFLQKRSLASPDQRSLYQYHCTSDEYLDLRDTLRRTHQAHFSGGTSVICAAFVLFTAEWYRREYQTQHEWQWKPVMDALGISLSSSDRDTCVPIGMGYWGRAIHKFGSARRDFLGSVFAEGGLPFQLLSETGSRFQVLLERLIEQHESAVQLGVSPIERVRREVERLNLPQAFGRPASLQLFSDMNTTLLQLVRDHALADVDDPVDVLTRQYPRWRESFPLPLDIQTGTQLLNGLLRSATATQERRQKKDLPNGKWQCTHIWSLHQPNRLALHLQLPEVLGFAVQGRFDIPRFDLSITEGEHFMADLGSSFARLDAEDSAQKPRQGHLRPRQRPLELTREHPQDPLRCAVSHGGAKCDTLAIPRSAVPLGDEPVGFSNAEGQWRHCGDASFDTMSQDVMVVLPQGCAMAAVRINGEVVSDAFHGPQCCGLESIRIEGSAVVEVFHNGECYRIQTGHEPSQEWPLALLGDQFQEHTQPNVVFKGLPHLSQDLVGSGAKLFIDGKATNEAAAHSLLGSRFVAVRNADSKTLMRRKVGILPADFSLKVRAGSATGQATVQIETLHPVALAVKEAGLVCRTSKDEELTELHLQASGVPPATFTLLVTPSLSGGPIAVTLPFPTIGSQLFDAEGLAMSKTLCLDQLRGTRLFLFKQPKLSQRHHIEMSLRGHTAKNAYYQWEYNVSQQPIEISLLTLRDHMEDLLSLQGGVDQVVEMTVTGNGSKARYQISRYAAELRHDHALGRIVVERNSLTSGLMPQPMLVLLGNPSQAGIPLAACESEGVFTGEFQIPAEVAGDGPWLVVPAAESPATFRPCFLPGNLHNSEAPAENDDAVSAPVIIASPIETLEQACRAFHPKQGACPFEPVFNAMTANPHHSGWDFLQHLYENFAHLSLQVFEVWRALVKHPRALAMMLFKLRMDQTFIERLENEFDLIKEFQPLSAVREAAEHHLMFLLGDGVAHEVAIRNKERMLKRLELGFPAYGENVMRHLAGQPVKADARLPLAAYVVFHEESRQELMRSHPNETWPSFGATDLARWHKRLPEPLLTSLHDDASHRHAVIYLPMFVAAVATGHAKFQDLFTPSGDTIFALRQVRNFDSQWFNAMFEYSAARLLFLQEKAKDNRK